MQYYYYAATLPMVSLDDPPMLTVARFLSDCEEHLVPRHMAALRSVMGEVPAAAASSFERSWSNYDTQLRNALARMRATRTERDATPFVRETEGFDLTAEKTASDAFSRDNPRDRERLIDGARWRKLTALAGFDPFGIDAILAYGLQLQMAERWSRLDSASGRQKADVLIARAPAGDEHTRSDPADPATE